MPHCDVREVRVKFANARLGLVAALDHATHKTLEQARVFDDVWLEVIIVRAIGPSLTMPGAMADPTLELRDANGILLGSNDNWRSAQETAILAMDTPQPVLKISRLTFDANDRVVEYVRSVYRGDRYHLTVELR